MNILLDLKQVRSYSYASVHVQELLRQQIHTGTKITVMLHDYVIHLTCKMYPIKSSTQSQIVLGFRVVILFFK